MNSGKPMSDPGDIERCRECDEELDDTQYVCEKCSEPVVVCSACMVIVTGCPCGHCPIGNTFVESE